MSFLKKMLGKPIEEILPTINLFTKNKDDEYVFENKHYSIIIAKDGMMWRMMLFLKVPEEEYMECLASVTFDEGEPIDSKTIFEEINYIVDYALHNHNEFEEKYIKELINFKDLIIINYNSPETNIEPVVDESIDEDLAKNNNDIVKQLEERLSELEEKLNYIIKRIG